MPSKTDQQLLSHRQLTEMSAAAVGIHGEWNEQLQGVIQRDIDGKRKPAPVWRPLEDVAQAWFLIWQLHIDIVWDLIQQEVSAVIYQHATSATEHFTDFEAGGKQALCRAVVRCAASMPPIAHSRQQPQQEE
jgi:hypothetical protein